MNSVEIAIATYPAGISLDQEIRLLKPALLYADHVTLYSPVVGMLITTRAVGDLPDAELITLLRSVGPSVAALSGAPDPNEALDHYESLRRKRKPSIHEIRAMYGMKKILADFAKETTEVIDGLLEKARSGEILPAVEAGLVTVDPILRDGENGEEFSDACFERFRELLLSRSAFPLLDEGVGDLARAALNEGVWKIGATAARRAKEVSAASRFMEQMPVFPSASIGEVLEVRERLRKPLVRFRAAMIEIERLIASAAHDEDFDAEVEDVFRQKVAPALQEIEEALADDKYLHQLAGAVIGDAKTYATACITLCVAHFTHMPVLLTATGIGAGAAHAAAQAAWRKSVGARETGRRQMFFLYKLDKLLAKNRAA